MLCLEPGDPDDQNAERLSGKIRVPAPLPKSDGPCETAGHGNPAWTLPPDQAIIEGMTLEDHLGDILHKARDAASVTLNAAAGIAGLTVAELQKLEETGYAGKRFDLPALSRLLKLDPVKLDQIAAGWLPAAVDLSRWRELRPIVTANGGYRVNCYLVWDEATREAALFDTGWEAPPILSLVAENRLDLKHLFVTHTHEDHVAAQHDLEAAFPGLRIHTSGSRAPVAQRNRPQDCVAVGSLRVTVRETPGHSADGVTYVVGGFPENARLAAIIGDSLFAGSIGRGFFSTELLLQKVREQVLSLPPETLLCPGHGPFTNVAEEKEHNPFF